MATYYGFELVQNSACILGNEMRCYEYKDHARNLTANIYLNSIGDVSYHSQAGATAWHGHWRSDPQECMIVVQFSEEGPLTNITTTVFFLCQPANPDGTGEIWVGRDNRQRKVSLKLLDRYRECTRCNMWHIV